MIVKFILQPRETYHTCASGHLAKIIWVCGLLHSVSARMEWSNKVDDALGHAYVKLFIAEVREGKIQKKQVKKLALLMHVHVHGVFEEEKKEI